MQKRNQCVINTGHQQKCTVGDSGLPTDYWDITRDLVFGRILSENLYPVDVDILSKECYKESY
jgi:hypothetical protein